MAKKNNILTDGQLDAKSLKEKPIIDQPSGRIWDNYTVQENLDHLHKEVDRVGSENMASVVSEINRQGYPLKAIYQPTDGGSKIGFFREVESVEKKWNPRLNWNAPKPGGYQYGLVFKDGGYRPLDEKSFQERNVEFEESKRLDEPHYVHVEDTDDIYRTKLRSGADKANGDIKAEVEQDELVLIEEGEGYKVIHDFKNADTHEEGGQRYTVKDGEIVIPADKRDITLKAISDEDWEVIDDIRDELPKTIPSDNELQEGLDNEEEKPVYSPLGQTKAISSFLKDAVEKQGKQFTPDAEDKILSSYNYDYDRIIDDMGKRMGVGDDKLQSFREGIYTKYDIVKPDEENVAEITFLRQPIGEGTTGYERYQQLQEERNLAEALMSKRTPEDLQLYREKVPAGLPSMEAFTEDFQLTPEARKEKAQKEYGVSRVADIEKRIADIDAAMAEQAEINRKELGYVSREHEAVTNQFKQYDTMLDDAIKERQEKSIAIPYTGITAYTKDEQRKVRDLRNIKDTYQQISKLLGAPQGEGFDEQVRGALYGFGNNFFTKDFATLGLNEMSRLLIVKDAFEARNELIKEGKTEEEIQQLMPQEQRDLLDTYQLLMEVQAGTKQNFGVGIGEGLKDMLPFIAQFAATGGAGASAKKLVKDFVTRKTKSAVAGQIAGTVARPLTQAAVMFPATLQNYAERVAPTLDESGQLVEGENEWQAIAKAYLTTVAEVAGEDIGQFANKWANKAARKNFAKIIANNPNKAQEFLGKLQLAVTRETGMPAIQGLPFEILGEEATGLMQAAIDQDGSFFTPEAQKQLLVLSALASGGFAAASGPRRIATKVNFNQATNRLNDIPNAEYVSAVESISQNYTEPEEMFTALDDVNKQFAGQISQEDVAKGLNYLANSVSYNQMNTARAIQIEENIAKYQGNDGNVTMVNYQGQPYAVRNPEALGQPGEVVFLKAQDDTVIPVISSKISNPETKSPDQIVTEQISEQDQIDEAEAEMMQMQEEAAARGLVEGNTIITPNGKRTLVSLNPDGTSTVVDQKGEESVVNTPEIEAYKTQEQKEAEKVEEEAQSAMMEGIAEGAEVVSDEALAEGSDIRVVDFSNGQSKIITPEGEQVFNTPEERDAAISELAQSEIEAAEDNIDDMAPDEAYKVMYAEDPEIATEILQQNIDDMQAEANEARNKSRETKVTSEKKALITQARELEANIERYNQILADPEAFIDEAVEEEVIQEEVLPEQETFDQADALYNEYLEEEKNTPYNQLEDWQKELLGSRITSSSFNRFGDRNQVNQSIARAWFIPTDQAGASNEIDVLAEEISQTTGQEVTPQDIVDFIVGNPTNTVRKTTDRMNEIRSDYNAVTGQSINNHNVLREQLGLEAVPAIEMAEDIVDDPLAVAEAPEVAFKVEDQIGISEIAKPDVQYRSNAIKALNELQAKFGVPIEIISPQEMSEEAKRKAEAIGAPDAYYQNGTVYIISDAITSVKKAKKIYMHEAVLHKGLDVLFNAGPVKLLGKTYNSKNELLDEVFDRLDEQSITDRAQIYLREGESIDNLTDNQKRELAEEALATLSERESPRAQVLLDKLYNFIKRLFGLTNKQFSKADLRNMLREHQELLKQQRDAETIRSDERQVPEGRDVTEEGAAEGRETVQQPTEARTETGDAEGVKFRTVKGADNLVVLHNLSEENIRNIDKMGGLPVPSLAVARTDIPFESYGEISLVADKSMVDPQGYGQARTFNADIYSPRYPDINYDLNWRKFDEIFDGANDNADKFGITPISIGSLDLERSGLRKLSGENISMLAYLMDKGKMPRPKMRNAKVDKTLHKWIKPGWVDSRSLQEDPEFVEAVTEIYRKIDEELGEGAHFVKDGKVNDNLLRREAGTVANTNAVREPDAYENRQLIQERATSTAKKKAEYEQWIIDKWESIVEDERIFKGITQSGSRRYVPHTLDNVVKELTKGLQGEEGMFYGVGSVRSGAAKEFESIEEIQRYREDIVGKEEFKEAKDEAAERFDFIRNLVKPYYKYDTEGWGYDSNVGESLLEYAKKGRSSDFTRMPKEVKDQLNEFFSFLKYMPSEYFESKVQRAVDLNEFKAAVIPNNTSQDVIDILENNGLAIKKYNPKKEGDRTKKTELTARQQDVKFRVETPSTSEEITSPEYWKGKTFGYIHNTEPSPYMGEQFGQDVEPSGKYITMGYGFVPANHQEATVTFNEPLVIDITGQEYPQWKRDLSKEYLGATGQELSDKLREKGYDSIITVEEYKGKYYPSETIILDNEIDSNKGSRELLPDIRFRVSPYRGTIPNFRGITKDKIRKAIKDQKAASGTGSVVREISKFDSPEEFAENLFWHGTGTSVSGGLKPSITMSQSEAERAGGGGYGERYWGVSASKSKNKASNFTGQSRSGTVYPVILRKDANVISMPKIEDAVELEDIIEDLWSKKIDAVKIGDWTDEFSEEEIVILNPKAAYKFNNGENFQVYQKQRFNNPTSEDIENIYNKSKELVEELNAVRTESKDVRNEKLREVADQIDFKSSADQPKFRVADSQQELDDFVKDSKVKETVYHGTNADFDEFDIRNFGQSDSGWLGKGFYFTDDIEYAESYVEDPGRLMSVKLDMRNPYIFRKLSRPESLNKELGVNNAAEATALLKEQGYDSIMQDYEGDREFIVFSSDQILIEPTEDVKFRVVNDIQNRIDQESLTSYLEDNDLSNDEINNVLQGKDNYWIEQYLDDEYQISIDDNGLVSFNELDEDIANLIGDNDVLMYHHTSTGVLDDIKKEGLIETGVDVNRQGEIEKGVYLTTRYSGTEVEGYKNNAVSVHGGDPLTLEVKTKIKDLEPDRDDEDISAGNYQFTSYYNISPDNILNLPESDVKFRIEQERDKVNTDPSEAQIEAGNYQMGHVNIDGLDISIENPIGSIREGKAPDGERWSNIMPADYGYIRKTTGADGDQVDVFLGPNLESDRVFIVDQVDPKTGKYDEAKVMLGFNSLSEARNTYNEAYDQDWQGLGAITPTTKDGLKEWIKGNTKKPYALTEEDVKFRVTSQDPEVQKALDRLEALRKASKAAARVTEMEGEVKKAMPLEREYIQDQIKSLKEGVKLGKAEAKEMIKEVQKAITDYAKKKLPLTEAGAREISPILTLVKDAQTPEAIEKAFNKIDELTGRTEEKRERRKNTNRVNRLLTWMTGLKKVGQKKVGKFNYADTKDFLELGDVDKRVKGLVKQSNARNATAEEKMAAESQLEALWQEYQDKPEKTNLDHAIMKLIELRRLGSKASAKLAQTTADELEAIYKVAKEAKNEADLQKALTNQANKDEIIDYLETDDKVKKMPWFKKAMRSINTGTADIMSNWETLMTMIGGSELRDKMSFLLDEAQMTVGRQETMDTLLDKAKDIYGSKSKKETLSTIHDLSAEEYELRQPNRRGQEGKGDPMKLSRLQLMDIYNGLKNPDIERDYYLAYGDITLAEDGSRDIEAQMEDGKQRIDALLENLTEVDKEFADFMQAELDKYYDGMNEIYINLYNRDLPRVENYWPSSAEREQDVDIAQLMFTDSRHPGATKERSAHRTPIPMDAFNKFVKHVDESEWYTNMAMPIYNANKLFKDNNIKTLIEDARGRTFYNNISDALQNVGLTPPSKMQQSSKLNSLLNTVLGNWVVGKIGMSPSVVLKQLLSTVNYAENMPASTWAKNFVKDLSNPKETWKEMMKIPYLKTRLGEGYSEAVQRALNGDEQVHKSKVKNYHDAFKNLMTIGTRYGDITAIIFGGKPYIDYMIKEQGLSEKEAVDKFLQDTLRSQQSPFSSSLSKLQNSKNPFARAMFTFANTPSQYMRKLFEANQNYRVAKRRNQAGKMSDEDFAKVKKQTAKAHTIYGVINTITFTMAGSLINAMMKGSDIDDEIWKDMLAQLSATYVGGLPVIKDILDTATRQTLDMKVYDDVNPYVESAGTLLTEGGKLLRGEATERTGKLIGQSVADMIGIPYQNLSKNLSAIPPMRKQTVKETRVRETDDKLTRFSKSNFVPKADAAKEVKQAYGRAKAKATKLEKDGKLAKAARIRDLIERSKINLWKSNFKVGDMKNEAKMFSAMVDRI